jgi:hypothetical protein
MVMEEKVAAHRCFGIAADYDAVAGDFDDVTVAVVRHGHSDAEMAAAVRAG